MKKNIKRIVSSIVMIFLFLNLFVFNVSAAASATVSGGEYNVDNNVNISIKISNDTPIMTAQIIVNYDPAVLKFQSVSGAESTSSSGSINIVDDDFSTATKDVKTGSYTLKFTALAEGTTNVTSQVKIVDKSANTINTTGTAKVSVVRSSNANLSSITLSKGSLSPAFNPNITDYNVKVKYDVDEITITGSPADGGAKIVGNGTFGLEIGDNERIITVTAADGSKKSYTINIKRMTEQETADAEQAARDANPLLVIINGKDYTISNDLTGITIPVGFTPATATRKESEITVLNDDAGKYQLCWLVDANGENGAFYSRDSEDNFAKLVYIIANGKLYIIEELGDYGTMPSGFILSKCGIDGIDVDAITYEDENLRDFYVFKCYVGGTVAYYRFDTVEGTIQRALDFDAALTAAQTDAPAEHKQNTGKFAWFTNMNNTGKAVFLIVVFVAVLLIAVAVILIVKIASSGKDDYEDEYISAANNDFILNDFSDDTDNSGSEFSEVIEKNTEEVDNQVENDESKD